MLLCSYVHSFVGPSEAKNGSCLAKEGQSRAPRRWRGRQIAEEKKSFRDLSQASSAWDFFCSYKNAGHRKKGQLCLKYLAAAAS